MSDLESEPDVSEADETSLARSQSTSESQVFISYHSDDEVIVDKLGRNLRRPNVKFWLSSEKSDEDYLEENIKESKIMLMCVSESYMRDEKWKNDLKICEKLKKKVIKVLLEPLSSDEDENEMMKNLPSIPFFSTNSEKVFSKRIQEIEKRINEILKQDISNSREKSDFHIGIFCAPDKKFEMGNLSKRLHSYGYNCCVMKGQQSAANTKCDVIIAALSLRFLKSAQVSNEVISWSRMQKAIVPVLLDKIAYPPNGMTRMVFGRLEPIQCYNMPLRSRDHWNTEETEEILDRLEALIPDVNPIRLPRREKSSIPLGKNHIKSLSQPVPMDPLAREASEIRIQIRPPTPGKNGESHIPVSKRRGSTESHSKDVQEDQSGDESMDEESEKKEMENEDSEDGEEEEVSTDSEVRTAKEMQNGYKLPQLQNGRRRVPYSPSSADRRRRYSTSSKTDSHQLPQSLPNRRAISPQKSRVTNSHNNTRTQTSGREKDRRKARQNFYNPDGPKLPSVYRKRFAVH